MKFWGIATFFVLFVIGAIAGTQATSGPSADFDFEAATRAERTAWMEEVNRGVVDGARKTLPDGRGGAPQMTVASSEVDVDARTITTVIQIHGPSAATMSQSAAQAALNREACPDFVEGPLLTHRIRLVTIMKDQTGKTAVTLETSPRTCAGYVETAGR